MFLKFNKCLLDNVLAVWHLCQTVTTQNLGKNTLTFIFSSHYHFTSRLLIWPPKGFPILEELSKKGQELPSLLRGTHLLTGPQSRNLFSFWIACCLWYSLGKERKCYKAPQTLIGNLVDMVRSCNHKAYFFQKL